MADDAVEKAMLAEARAEVALADHKATMVLTALGVGAGAVVGGLLAGDWEPSEYEALSEVVWWLGAAIAVLAVVSAASAVWPRYAAKDLSNGIFYWGHVATFDNLADFEAALDNDASSAKDRTRHQLHRLSLIVKRKYDRVRLAMGSAGVAGVLFLLAGLFA